MKITNAIEFLENKDNKYTVKQIYKVLSGWDTDVKNTDKTNRFFWVRMLGDEKYLATLASKEASKSIRGFFSSVTGNGPLSQLKGLYEQIKSADNVFGEKLQKQYIDVVKELMVTNKADLLEATFKDPEELIKVEIAPALNVSNNK